MTETDPVARARAEVAATAALAKKGTDVVILEVGEILGIADRSAVREQLPRPKPSLAALLDELV